MYFQGNGILFIKQILINQGHYLDINKVKIAFGEKCLNEPK